MIAETLLSGAVTDAELVIEAIVEDAQAKNSLFKCECNIMTLYTLITREQISFFLLSLFPCHSHCLHLL